jgi:uncharacterized protein (DUF1697 family)
MPYLALLRGINVGGNNIIPMAALKKCFEDMGFTDVATYIQSGNVIFTSPETSRIKLTEKIEKQLSKQFHYESRIVLITEAMLQEVIKQAPPQFGTNPEQYRYDVLFIKEPLTAKEAIKSVSTREGVDTAHHGKHALYFSRLISRASQSHLTKIIKSPIYKNLTIRNWNTTTKLLERMSQKAVLQSSHQK